MITLDLQTDEFTNTKGEKVFSVMVRGSKHQELGSFEARLKTNDPEFKNALEVFENLIKVGRKK